MVSCLSHLLDGTKKDLAARLAHDRALARLQKVILLHTVDASGHEQHVIAVDMRREEKEIPLRSARGDYRTAQRQIDNELGDQQIADNTAFNFATSDVIESDEAVALGDLLHDPETTGLYGPQREDAMRELNTLGPIVTALEADLTQPNRSL